MIVIICAGVFVGIFGAVYLILRHMSKTLIDSLDDHDYR